MVKVTSGSFGPHRTEKLGLEVAPNQALECVRYAHRTAPRPLNFVVMWQTIRRPA